MIIFLLLFLLFILGSAIGSFLTVVVDRIPQGKSIIFGRSVCDSCKKSLRPLDLIPVLSFFLVKRHCRYCQAELGWHYVLIEILTGAAFVFVGFLALSANIINPASALALAPFLYFTFLLCCLIILFFIDLFYGILPFSVIGIAVLTTALWYWLSSFFHVPAFPLPSSFEGAVISAIGAFLFFLFLFLATKKRGMGFGDVVYAFFMGFLLGFPGIITGLYVAFLTGAIVSLILIVLGKKKLRGGAIPFGPFLVLGTVVTLFWGNMITAFFSRFV